MGLETVCPRWGSLVERRIEAWAFNKPGECDWGPIPLNLLDFLVHRQVVEPQNAVTALAARGQFEELKVLEGRYLRRAAILLQRQQQQEQEPQEEEQQQQQGNGEGEQNLSAGPALQVLGGEGGGGEAEAENEDETGSEAWFGSFGGMDLEDEEEGGEPEGGEEEEGADAGSEGGGGDDVAAESEGDETDSESDVPGWFAWDPDDELEVEGEAEIADLGEVGVWEDWQGVCQAAASAGHLEILKWGRLQPDEKEVDTSRGHGEEGGADAAPSSPPHEQQQQHLCRTVRLPWSQRDATIALRRGHFSVLQWMLEIVGE
uniref:Uncharacterized protein n=1 Tax=Chromera velia CCMP2878 TaxID=1169474 RepID=A0A0G4H9B4_9ALVE|eukprot:Cvel_5969.t1-p1 / transcript=Cvel_5969.t1 / gene=Cvel_5969 / organism=Chromera_velia_CCMP2878 / gene_product=hypothetical protein / transcript_product=hypothetical protein / location=Cvel_scaffold286:8521-9784(-) / protein_length=316 / sequence_SO=supercontig / SO=protein_coding / is_pseudo=false